MITKLNFHENDYIMKLRYPVIVPIHRYLEGFEVLNLRADIIYECNTRAEIYR